MGCYQIRSHSSGDNQANHYLKLSLGYGVHPIIRGEDQRGVYFVLPLWSMEETKTPESGGQTYVRLRYQM